MRTLIDDDDTNLSELSQRVCIAWAKSTYTSKDDDVFAPNPLWLPLFYHCADAGHIGKLLAQEWFALRQRKILAQALEKTQDLENKTLTGSGALHRNEIAKEEAEDKKYCSHETTQEIDALCAFVCSIHDIGKLTPAFASQVPNLAQRMEAQGFSFADIDKNSHSELPHSVAGEIILRRYLTQRQRWNNNSAKAIASLAGAHHGIPPISSEVRDKELRHDLLGTQHWEEAQYELLDWCIQISGAQKYMHKWASIEWKLPELAILSGLTIAADWIASNTNYFPLINTGDEVQQDREYFRARAQQAWSDNSGIALPVSWQPRDPSVNYTAGTVEIGQAADKQLQQEFSLPADSHARPMQRAAFQAASEIHEPALLLLEDTMGSGKTEAALLAAHILAARSGTCGVWFTLPTQTTATAMFHRLLAWIERIAQLEGEGSDFAVQLSHGRAQLDKTAKKLKRSWRSFPKGTHNTKSDHTAGSGSAIDVNECRLAAMQSFNALPIAPNACDVGRDEQEKIDGDASLPPKNDTSRIGIHPWQSGKKALLADFVTSTIDQLLMLALKSRHLALRHLGASRKVVIIDEVHAADVYMNVYLCKAIEWLAAYGISVIALSATLDDASRANLLSAYQQGRKLANRVHISVKKKKQKWRERARLNESITNSEGSSAAVISQESSRKDIEPISYYPAISIATHTGISAISIDSNENSTVKLRTLEHGIGDFLRQQLKSGGCSLVVRNTVGRAQETYKELKPIFGDDVILMHARFAGGHREANDKWLLEYFGKNAREGKRPKRAVVVATQVVEQSLDIDFDVLVSDLCPIDVLLQRIGRVHRHTGRKRPNGLTMPICWLDAMPCFDAVPQCERGGAAVYSEKLLFSTALALRKYINDGELMRVPGDIRMLMRMVYAGENLSIPAIWEEKYCAATVEFEDKRNRSHKNAEKFCLASPLSSTELGNSLDGWVTGKLDGTEDALIRAGVREGQDSIEVILVNEGERRNMATWSILPGINEGVAPEIPVNRDPSYPQSQALMNSMVRLPASFTRSEHLIDDTIAELEKVHPQWSEHTPMYGQLVLPLYDGEATLMGRTLRYSRECGLVEVKDGK